MPKAEPKFLTRVQRLQLAKEEIYRKAFAGLTLNASNQIRNMIIKEMLSPTPNPTRLIKKLQELFPKRINYAQAENIVRTESHEIRLQLWAADAQSQDVKQEHLYRWVGPSDRRTTEVCEFIKLRTMNGVTLKELKKIIREEAKKFNPKFEVRDFTPHFQCRHRAVRVFKNPKKN